LTVPLNLYKVSIILGRRVLMKVFYQTWRLEHGGPELNSISRDLAAYQEAVENAANPDEDSEEGPAHPTGELMEITIPDDNPFADMVEARGTVFLHYDEMDFVWEAPEWRGEE
jgi:hypothetical protein